MKRIATTLLMMIMISTLSACTEEKKEGVIKVGAMLHLSGLGSTTGESMRNGIDLALKDVDNVEVIYEDLRGFDPKSAVSIVNKFINLDNVDVLITQWAEESEVAGNISHEKQIPLIVAGSSGTTLDKIGDYVFSFYIQHEEENALLAKYLKEEGYDTASTIYALLTWGFDSNENFVRHFKNVGGTIVSENESLIDQKDFRTLIAKIANENSEVLHVHQSPTVWTQMKEAGLKKTVVATEYIEGDSDMWAILPSGALDGVTYTYMAHSNQAFHDTYLETYKLTPTAASHFSFDTIKILSSLADNGHASPKEINRELYNVKNYQGVSGEITVDENGNTQIPIKLKRVIDGAYTDL